MDQPSERLWWATPPKRAVVAGLLIFIADYLLVMVFYVKGMTVEAVLVAVVAIALLLVGSLDLLSQLVMLGRRIEKMLESKSP